MKPKFIFLLASASLLLTNKAVFAQKSLEPRPLDQNIPTYITMEGMKTGPFGDRANKYQIEVLAVQGATDKGVSDDAKDKQDFIQAKASATAPKFTSLSVTTPLNDKVFAQLKHSAETGELLPRVAIVFEKRTGDGKLAPVKEIILEDAMITKLTGPQLSSKDSKVQDVTFDLKFKRSKIVDPSTSQSHTSQDTWDVKTNN